MITEFLICNPPSCLQEQPPLYDFHFHLQTDLSSLTQNWGLGQPTRVLGAEIPSWQQFPHPHCESTSEAIVVGEETSPPDPGACGEPFALELGQPPVVLCHRQQQLLSVSLLGFAQRPMFAQRVDKQNANKLS